MNSKTYGGFAAALRATLLSLLLTSCFNPIFDSKGSIGGGGDGAGPAETIRTVTTIDKNSATPQTIALDSTNEELAGTAVTFPPGSLSISTAITVEQAATIDSTMLQNIGLTDTGVAEAGAGVIIRPAENTEAVNPFTIQLPIPKTTSLRLADNTSNMVVLFHVWKNSESSLVGGVLPLSELTMVGGFITFDTKYFGAYQVTILTKKIEEKKEVVTTEPIRNANNVPVVNTSGLVKEETIQAHESLPTIGWDVVRLKLDGATRKLFVEGEVKSNGITIKSCRLTLNDRRDIGPDPLILEVKGPKAELFIPHLSAITVYGQLACIDGYDRLSISPWSDGLKVPAVQTVASLGSSRKVVLYTKPPQPVAGYNCRAMVSDRADMSNAIFSPVLTTLEWVFEPNNPNPHTIYGRFVCVVVGRETFSLTSSGVSIPAGTGGVSGFTIGPPQVYINYGQPYTFTAAGGVAPYTWEIWEGGYPSTLPLGTGCGLFSANQSSATFTGGDHPHNYTIKAIDSTGKIAQSDIKYIIPPYLGFTSMTLRPKAMFQINLMDGVPGFTPIKTGPGNISSTGDPWIWQFHASNLPNQSTDLQFRDAVNQYSSMGNIMTLGEGVPDPLYGATPTGAGYLAMMPDAMSGMELVRLAFSPAKDLFAAGWARRTGTGFWDYFGVSKLDPNGIIPTSWGADGGQSRNINGQEGRPEHAKDLVVFSDNSVALVGNAFGVADYDITVAKFRPDGSPDTDFGTDGFVQHEITGDDDVRAATLAAIGGQEKILIGGTDGNGDAFVAMLNAVDGTPDSAFNTTGFVTVPGMLVVNDIIFNPTSLKIIVAGQSQTGDFAYAALTTAGSMATGVISQGPGEAHQVKHHMPSGGYVIVGRGTSPSGWLIVKTDSTLAIDTGFGSGTGMIVKDWGDPGSTHVAYAVAVQNDGKIVVAGSQGENYPTTGFARMLRIGPNGDDDMSFNSSGTVTYQPCCTQAQAWRFIDVLIDETSYYPRILALANNFNDISSHVMSYIITTPAAP
jgi:uncharacterized delta-60 repeat protein